MLPSATVRDDSTVTVTAKLPELSGSIPIALTVPVIEVVQPAGVTGPTVPGVRPRTWALVTEVVTVVTPWPTSTAAVSEVDDLVTAGEVDLEQASGVRRPQRRQPS